jgi:N-acylneuraminate cytidylyltransferase
VTKASGLRVAVIPARGGSKRVPRKNVRQLDGRPLTAWAIDVCQRAEVFDRILVSTDDDEVAAIAVAAGAEVPFVRPAELSDDHTALVPVIAHTLEHIGVSATDDVAACCVYPTAVGLDPVDLGAAWREFSANEYPYLTGVVRYGHPIQRALARAEDGGLSMVDPSQALTRTQDLEPRWHDAGQFVWGRAEAWLTGVAVLTNAAGYELPVWRTVDLDTEEDWLRAELIHPLIRASALG